MPLRLLSPPKAASINSPASVGHWCGVQKNFPIEEIQMLRNRMFNLLIAIALVIVVALTVREATAISSIVAKTDSANQSDTECSSLPSHYSIHSEYVEEIGTAMTFTEDGPTGVDGGLIHLLSAYRTCSR
jgi:hypothetical protein